MTRLTRNLTVLGMVGLTVILMSCATIEEQQQLEEEVQEQEERIVELREERDQAREQLEQQEQRMEELEQKEQQLAQVQEELDRMEVELEDIDDVEVVREEDVLTVRIGAHILFGTLQAELRNDSLQTLQEIANVVEQYQEREIRFEGHADNRPIISSPQFDNNRELAAARALSVLQWFEANSDIPPERMASTSYGEFRPIAPNNTPDNMQKNRRVEIVLYPADLPEEEI